LVYLLWLYPLLDLLISLLSGLWLNPSVALLPDPLVGPSLVIIIKVTLLSFILSPLNLS
jgi:hypothetical protein